MTQHYMATDGNVYLYRTAGSRPVVVINPEDTKQVKGLAFACSLVRYNGGSSDGSASHLQDALRSLIEPPKPEEPLGLGAVIEDTSGVQWVRMSAGPSEGVPWRRTGPGRAAWDTYNSITAVKVLSEGVQS